MPAMMTTPTMETAPIFAEIGTAVSTIPEDALTTPLPTTPIASAVTEMDGDDDDNSDEVAEEDEVEVVEAPAAGTTTIPKDALNTPLPTSPIASAITEMDGDDDDNHDKAVQDAEVAASTAAAASEGTAQDQQVEETTEPEEGAEGEEEAAEEESTTILSSFVTYVVSDYPPGYGEPVVEEDEDEKEPPTVVLEEKVIDDEGVVVKCSGSNTETSSHHDDSTKLMKVEDTDCDKDAVESFHSNNNHEFTNEYAEYDEETLAALKRQVQHMNVILAKIHEIQERTLVQPLQKRLYRSQQQQEQQQPQPEDDDDDEFDPDLDNLDDYELPAPSAEDLEDFDFKEDIQGNIPMTASHSEELLRRELSAIDEMLNQTLGGGKQGGSNHSHRELARSELKRIGLSVDTVAEMDALAATKSTVIDGQKKKGPSTTAPKMSDSKLATIPQPNSVEEEETRHDQPDHDTNKRENDDSNKDESGGGRDEAEVHNEAVTSYTTGPTLPSCDCAAMTFLACTDYWGGNVCGIGNSDVDDLVLCNAAPSLRKVAGDNSDKVLLDADETTMESFACMAVDQIERKAAAVCKSPRRGDDDDEYDDDDDILAKAYPLRKDDGLKQNAKESKEQPIDDLLLEETLSSFESERSSSFHQSFAQPPSLSTISEHYSRESLSMTMTTPSNRPDVAVPKEEEVPMNVVPFCGDVDEMKPIANHENEANKDTGTSAMKNLDNHDDTSQSPPPPAEAPPAETLPTEAMVPPKDTCEKNVDKVDSPQSTIGLNNIVNAIFNAIRPNPPVSSISETDYDDQAAEETAVLVNIVSSHSYEQYLPHKEPNKKTSAVDTPVVVQQESDEPELVAILQRPTASLGSSGQEVVRIPTKEEVDFLQLPLLDTAGRPDHASSTDIENDIPNVSLKRKLRRPSQSKDEDHVTRSLQYELSMGDYQNVDDDLLPDENTDGCIDPKPVCGDKFDKNMDDIDASELSDEDMDDVDVSELSDVLERLVDRFKTVVSDGDDQPFDCK